MRKRIGGESVRNGKGDRGEEENPGRYRFSFRGI